MSDLTSSIKRQLKSLSIPLILALMASGLFVLLIYDYSLKIGEHLSFFTRDLAGLTQAPFYAGILSNIGVLLWWSAATMCFLSSAIIRKTGFNRDYFSFFLSFGIFLAYACLDDFFRLHESVLPNFVGIPTLISVGIYPVAIVVILAMNLKEILKTDFLPLLLALGFLGVAFVADYFHDLTSIESTTYTLIEDGGKFVGIVCFTFYFFRTSTQKLVVPPEKAYHPARPGQANRPKKKKKNK